MNETFWHLAAYSATLTNGSTNTAVAAVNDQILTRTTANNFILPRPAKLRAIYAAGVSLTNARMNTPSLRTIGLPSVGQINITLTVPSPPNIADWGDYGPMIPTADEISMEHTLGGGAPEVEMDLVWFQFGYKPAPTGPTYRIRYTATITCVAGTWVNGTITPDQTLPAGNYAVVGMDAMGTNLVGARLVFANGGYRPGVLARNTLAGVPHPMFSGMRMGQFGVFDSVNTPTLDALSTGACTAQTIFLDVVRLGNRTN